MNPKRGKRNHEENAEEILRRKKKSSSQIKIEPKIPKKRKYFKEMTTTVLSYLISFCLLQDILELINIDKIFKQNVLTNKMFKGLMELKKLKNIDSVEIFSQSIIYVFSSRYARSFHKDANYLNEQKRN